MRVILAQGPCQSSLYRSDLTDDPRRESKFVVDVVVASLIRHIRSYVQSWTPVGGPVGGLEVVCVGHSV